MTSDRAAQLFLITVPAERTPADAERLAKLLDAFAVSGMNRGLDVAMKIYRELHSGGCHLLSQGSACDCFLCRCDSARVKDD